MAAAPAAAPDWLWRRVESVVEAPAAHPAVKRARRRGSLERCGADAGASRGLAHWIADPCAAAISAGLAGGSRPRAAQAFLEARAADIDSKTRMGLIDAALRVIDAPELAALFGPQSKAEVAVAGRVALPLGGSIDVVGRIDRIGVTADEALIADFKTGAPCPRGRHPAAAIWRKWRFIARR